LLHYFGHYINNVNLGINKRVIIIIIIIFIKNTKYNKKKKIKTRLLLMSNINTIFGGMTRHPTHTASSLSFFIVHLGPNVSNWWTTFICPTHGQVGNHL